MPIYQVFHCIPLSDSQRDNLAIQITKCHCDNTGALPIFVNVTFTDTSNDPFQYIAGHRRPNNRILGTVRPRGDAGHQVLKDVVRDIQKAWEKIVGKYGTRELGVLFLSESLTEGLERGFELPKAYEDNEWAEKHKAEFQERADAGDPIFIELMKNINPKGRRTKEEMAMDEY